MTESVELGGKRGMRVQFLKNCTPYMQWVQGGVRAESTCRSGCKQKWVHGCVLKGEGKCLQNWAQEQKRVCRSGCKVCKRLGRCRAGHEGEKRLQER